MRQDPSWVFEAEVESYVNGRPAQRSDVAFDRGKYSIAITELPSPGVVLPPGSRSRAAVAHYLFDNAAVPVVWTFAGDSSVAMPTSATAMSYLARKINELGGEAARRRYRIPQELLEGSFARGPRSAANVSFYAYPNVLFYVFAPREYRSGQDRYVRAGTALVAGTHCEVYQLRAAERSVTMCVDPRTRLVLKWDAVTEANPRAAPLRTGYTATRIRYLRTIPGDRFRLSPGVIAELPRTMIDIPLPPGVRRQAMSGLNSDFGFDVVAAARQFSASVHSAGGR